MLFLALAVTCSVAIAAVFKAAEARSFDRTALLTVNYAAGAVVAVAVQGVAPAGAVDAGLVALGVVQGALFIGGFWLFSVAIRDAGMGLAAGVMRLSVVVPVLASWGVWGERPDPLQLVGLALAGVAFFLIARPAAPPPGTLGPSSPDAPETPPAPRRAALLLGALFLAGGLVDVMNKAFSEGYGGRVPEATFLLFVFGVAFALGAAVVVGTGLRTGRWPRGAVVGWGAALGVINYASADFFLRAIQALRGPFVFPANSVSVVFGAALVGWAVWHERLTRANLAGLAVAAVALVLLAR